MCNGEVVRSDLAKCFHFVQHVHILSVVRLLYKAQQHREQDKIYEVDICVCATCLLGGLGHVPDEGYCVLDNLVRRLRPQLVYKSLQKTHVQLVQKRSEHLRPVKERRDKT